MVRQYPEVDSHRRVVITGMGIVSPVGCTKDIFRESLRECHSRVHPRSPNDSGLTGPLGAIGDFSGRIEDFAELSPSVRKSIRKSLKLMNRETLLAVAAGQQALADSELLDEKCDRTRIGVVFGAGNFAVRPEDFAGAVQACSDESGQFDFGLWGNRGLSEVEPMWILRCLPNMPACYLAMFNSLQGGNTTVTEGILSANLAVAEGWHNIREGDVNAVLTGATGTLLDPLNLIRQNQTGDVGLHVNAAETSPEDSVTACFVPAEAAAAFVLESLDAAIARRAPIYGEIVGAAASCVVDSNGRGNRWCALGKAVQSTLSQFVDDDQNRSCGMSLPELHFSVLSDAAGDSGAGTGAIELAAGLLTLQDDNLPRSVADFRSTNSARDRDFIATVFMNDCFLNLSASLDGQASCLAIRPWNTERPNLTDRTEKVELCRVAS